MALDALDALHSRISSPRLSGSVSRLALRNLLRAALRAPDHALLRPWRFLTIEGDARQHLGELFAQASLSVDPDQTSLQLAKVKSKPMRAPLIIVGIASVTEHPKVPEIEQVISCGAAMQNMLVAAHAQGLGAMWRTGSMAYDAIVASGLGLSDNERVVGYLYVGQIEGRSRTLQELDVDAYCTEWNG